MRVQCNTITVEYQRETRTQSNGGQSNSRETNEGEKMGDNIESISIAFATERIEEINEKVENGRWQNRSEYLRMMVRAGESRVAELDPRTSSDHEENGQKMEEEILDKINEEWQSRDEVLDRVTDDLRGDLANLLHEMAENDEQSPVEFDPAKGYRLEE